MAMIHKFTDTTTVTQAMNSQQYPHVVYIINWIDRDSVTGTSRSIVNMDAARARSSNERVSTLFTLPTNRPDRTRYF